MIQKYVKKPLEVEALQWSGNEEEMVEFLGELFLVVDTNERLRINTLEGPMWANLGDYIIKGIKGEYYPCREDIFYATYDRVLSGEK